MFLMNQNRLHPRHGAEIYNLVLITVLYMCKLISVEFYFCIADLQTAVCRPTSEVLYK